MRPLALPGAPVELAEPQVAVGDERAHAARFGDGQRLLVMSRAALGVGPVGMGRDVTKQVWHVGREPRMTWRGFDRAIAQVPCHVEPAKAIARRDSSA